MTRDIAAIVAAMSVEEKARFLAGEDLWTTVAFPQHGIPKVKVTDGPNGARGATFMGGGGQSSVCAPCGSALGATWNPALVEEVGKMLGEEARTKGARVLLAPTVNLHRSPLAGRNFECYSEDPLLSGKLAAAFVRGVQSQNVATTVKHLVANDAEFERNTISSAVDQRTLRELYLLPFELAVKEGGTLGIMTSYNRLNGRYCSEREDLLEGIVREEWGFNGFVVTDWFAAGSTAGWAKAGVDLEMPGPPRLYGDALAAAVEAGDVDPSLLDAAAGRLLTVFDRIGALDDDGPEPEQSLDRPEHRILARRAATEAIVLLSNDGTLPLAAGRLGKVAVIGPNANRAQIMGGGSASLQPHYRRTPLEELTERLRHRALVVHHRGCDIDRVTPPMAAADVADTGGFDIAFSNGHDLDGPVVARLHNADGRMMFFGPPAPGVGERYSFRATARFSPPETGRYTVTLVQAGRARVSIGSDVILDGFADPPPTGTEFFGMGSQELVAEIDMVEQRSVLVTVEFANIDSDLLSGVKVGCRLPSDGDLVDFAAVHAAWADTAIVVVGTNDDWETEGRDRESMQLPGEQDRLIRQVAAANARTIVVVNTGAPVTMPWIDDVAAVVQVWFGGQEMAGAVADVLLGDSDPGGRLPTTIPLELEHNPSFGNFPGENSEVRYGEGVLMGYRWYEARHLPTRFPFGHGLSYTTFEIGAPTLSSTDFDIGSTVTVDVSVTNVGHRAGSEVVQCYVAPPPSGFVRPPKELKAFQKVHLEPRQSTVVRFTLDDRAFAHWDDGDRDWPIVKDARRGPVPASGAPSHRAAPGWYIEPGEHGIGIGRSSADIAHTVTVTTAGGLSAG